MSKAKAITQEFANANFLYDPATGKLTRKTGRRAGMVTGTLTKRQGYVQVNVGGACYLAHRIVWTILHGEIPEGMEVDHIDGVKANNRPENLRLATTRQNRENLRSAISSNKSGFLGATYHAPSRRWKAQIMVNGKMHSLKYHDSPEQAHKAYLAAKRKLHSFCTI